MIAYHLDHAVKNASKSHEEQAVEHKISRLDINLI